MSVTVRLLDGRQTAELEVQLRTVFAEAFAEPPYGEGPADVERAFRRFRSQVRPTGFRAVVAFDGETVVGMAYGYPLPVSTGWWDTVTEPVPEALRHEDGKRTFGLFELAVRPAWRRQGVATEMHHLLVDGIENQRVLLNSRPQATAAQAAYRAWGYRRVGEAIPWDGAVPHDVMILELTAGQ
ncbi:ribosomal protein S18 acetylase RimI-like enzyme [Kitasatospora sp. GP30]|uniref:GNAT family N-acetyltransferase n=1 Tax=Kitasatospora sp. GP30 TaxID=3035084 RepID=UPI000C7071ED|nr:GNAT family N-acetyltransferase [Kitasatospora sp. GP30]MDH6140547.1 ribosomal protein S18 acetylase RimI-like enzyme [Kitasatospora sp. GP30]